MRSILFPSIIGLCFVIGTSCGSKKNDETIEDDFATADDVSAVESEISDIPSSDAVTTHSETKMVDNAIENIAGSSSTNTNTYLDESGLTIYNQAEIEPAFSGGEKEMTKWLTKNLRYPGDGTEEGTVFVEFVVGENGHIRNSKVIRGPEDQALRDEALKAVNNMPAWTPGQQGGKPVNTKFILPITFKRI